MRFLLVGLVGLVLGCGDRDRSVPAGPAAKVSADCSLFEILSGKEGCAEDPSLDEVPEDYEAPSDSTMAAVTDTTETETVDADSTGAVDPEPVVADTTETVTAEPVSATDTFDIEVVFLPPSGGARDFTDHEKQLVLKAARRWEEKFLHGIPAAYLSEVDAGKDVLLEDEWRIRLPTVIDDIHIFVASEDLEDSEGVLWGSVGFFGDFLPRPDMVNTQPMGIISINVESISEYHKDEDRSVYRARADINIEDVVAHEIGHVLQGSEWWDFLRHDARDYPYFDGFHAKDQFDFYLSQGRISYTGIKVPLLHADINKLTHWYSDYMSRGMASDGRYRVFDFGGAGNQGTCWGAEIMSYAPHHPDCQEAISRVTLGALKDLGYPVDMSKAEYYRFFRDTIVKNPFDPERGGRPSPKPVVSTAHWCGASREVVELVRY